MNHLEKVFDNTNFTFETLMRVRQSETNIHQVLTIEGLMGLVAEAQSRFLYAKGIPASDNLIVTQVRTQVIELLKIRESVLIEIGVNNLSEGGGDFVFRIRRMSDQAVAACAILGFIPYDYTRQTKATLSEAVRQLLQS